MKGIFSNHRLAAAAWLVALSLFVACGDGGVEPAPESGAGKEATAVREGSATAAPEPGSDPGSDPDGGPALLGEGFVVWESNRSGEWRLWIRELDRPGARQLSADEDGRRHCCPHVSPDGAWIAYLSLPAGKQEYSDGAASGPLRLRRPDGSEERTVAVEARTYFEHRAAVWRSSEELIFIGGDGRTRLLELASGDVRPLTREPSPEYGYLIDATLSWATAGRADFSRYQSEGRRIVPATDRRGCQPYFSHDGRWGFWTAGVGGPINRLDLASGESSPILHKNDPRLPTDRGYLYFPMLSRDGLLLAFAASPDEHDHFRADYDVFVVETDPRTLEVIGRPVRMTDHPSTDRFPDVYLRPLDLGRHFGEAPLTVELEPPAAGDWRWSFGDGGEAVGRRASHLFAAPGRYLVTAVEAGRQTAGDPPAAAEPPGVLRGLVVVSPAAPPRPLGAELIENGLRIEVPFDEPLQEPSAGEPPGIELEPPTAVSGWSLSPDGRRLWIDLERPMEELATLRLSGLADRARPPNRMAAAELPIAPPFWPSDRDGLAFVWATADAPNQLYDPRLGSERLCSVRAAGGALLDHHFAMRLGRGTFVASAEDEELVLEAARASNRFSLEAFVTPGADGQIVAMGSRPLNFALRAEGGALHFTLRTGGRGPDAYQDVAIAPYAPGDSLHLVVTYEPGGLRAYVNGESAGEWPVSGDFFQWRRQPLVFGQAVTAAPGVTPTVEGVAIYDRPLRPAEARENYLRYRALREARPEVPRTVVEARLLRRSPTPELREISPYREALVVWEWQVTEVLEGEHPGGSTRVAHWAILDGETLAGLDLAAGGRRRLTLERFADNPQLEGLFVANELGPGPELWHDVE